ncbi:MAG: sigma 54-dependent Fis family transcriptional regulator [Deltaproteobacteria bacterium]|nr:sigma 54-dependent Fis family transcriptional regulator [Deltaproteobacteria bacterium]
MPTPKTQRVATSSLDSWVDGGVLEVVRGPSSGARVEVRGGRVVIGRAEGCDLVLDDARVSAAHLELVPTEKGVVLRDLGTTNGTRIGTLVVREAILGDGTEIAIGACELRFGYDDTPARVERFGRDTFHGLVGGSLAMRALYADLERLAKTRLNVLIEGETGTGKEVVARAVHEASPRSSAAFVTVDCGALAPTLVESTLFGHEKGAFSGAHQRQEGLVEAAHGGTLFLDELGELPLEAQTRLLRVLEARTIRRVGATKEIPVDVRVVSATHRDLLAMVAAGTFRADLFFRLATARVQVPPLRARKEDIPLLAKTLLARIFDDDAPVLDDEAVELLRRRDFPGNVRELRNDLEVAAAFATSGRIRAGDLLRRPSAAAAVPGQSSASSPLPAPRGASPSPATTLPNEPLGIYHEAKETAIASFERDYLERLMAEATGNITRAAARAGLERHSLRALLKKHALWKKEE